MTPPEGAIRMTRRHFFGRGASGLGIAGLFHLLAGESSARGGLPGLPHFAPKAKHIIYLFQSQFAGASGSRE